MYVAGFSINVLSMLAVVLAVGLVVDDAIVVTENIYLKIEGGMTPKQAGIEGSKEIFSPLSQQQCLWLRYFVPIVFLEGMTGRLFREFSIVIAGAVLISAFVALTFTPMLATKLLKKKDQAGWFYRKTDPFFQWLTKAYDNGLQHFLKHKIIIWPIIILTLVGIGYLVSAIPSEMAPLEDRSQITIRTSGPEGSTYEFNRNYTEKIRVIADSVALERLINTMRAWTGGGMINTSCCPILKTEKEARWEIANELTKAVRKETEARAFVQQQSTFGGDDRVCLYNMYCKLPTLKS